jgi:hypothetical protein
MGNLTGKSHIFRAIAFWTGVRRYLLPIDTGCGFLSNSIISARVAELSRAFSAI